MKGIIRLLFWVVALTTFCGTVSAQTGKQRLTREQLAEVQAKHIAKEMAMDDATSQRFIDTFCQFQRDIWALGPRPKQPHSQMTDEETEQALKDRFAHSQKILDLRQKYYGIYSEFLTQKQIRRVYELERQMMDRLSKRGKRPLIMAMLIAVSMVPTISAQDNNRQRMTPQQRTEQRIQKLDEKLSLTDNQKSQIRDLYADFYKQKYPKEKRKEAMEKLITDITAVLTSDQQVLYKQLQEEAAAERRKHAPKN